jgi:glycosyltransferase involved in cell wall biosynthesis
VRVLIDARPAADREKTGVGYYTWNLIHHLPAADPGTDYLAWYVHFRTVFRRWRHFADVAAPNLRERGVIYPSRLLERTARSGFPRVEWFGRFDVLFGTNFVPPPSRARRVVVTVHDLAFRRFPETAPQAVDWWLAAVERTMRDATRILVPSRATEDDLLELYDVPPAKVHVVPLAVDRTRFHPPSEERIAAVRRRFGVDGPYLIAIGRHGRKNVPRILSAFATLPRDLRPKLVVAGSPPWQPDGGDASLEALRALPSDVRGDVSFIGYVDDADKAALLGGSLGLVFPSLYEGFGFPVLEAMACGAPVLTADVSSMPELAGDAALLVDPLDVEAIASGLRELIGGDELRAGLREAGLERADAYDWPTTARRTAEVLHAAAEVGT